MIFNKKNFRNSILVIGVVVIPLLYSLFYLKAFWDPYNTLKNLPVAVVNEDTGASISDTQRNLGEELVEQLKDSNELKFTTTDATDAARGVREGKYYASITVPSDFSNNIASANSTSKTQAKLYYAVNQKHNYIASQILGKAVTQIEEELRGKISKELTQQLVVQLQNVPSQLSDMSSGLQQLSDGAGTLQSGAAQVQSGTETLKSGAAQLSGGLDSLKSGSASLASGTTQVNNGSTQLKSGLLTLQSGLYSLKSGSVTLQSGIANFKAHFLGDFATGAQTLSGGMQQLLAQFSTSSSSTLASQIGTLNSGAQQVSDGLGQLSTGAGSYASLSNASLYASVGSTLQVLGTNASTAVPGLLSGYKSQILSLLPSVAASNADATSEAVTLVGLYNATNTLWNAASNGKTIGEADFETAMQTGTSPVTGNAVWYAPDKTGDTATDTQLAAVAKELNQNNLVLTGKTVTGSISQIASGASQVSSGTQKLVGQTQAGDGTTLYDSVKALTDGAQSIAAQTKTTGSTDANSQTLADGITSIDTGATQLVSGASSAASGSDTLVSGATQIADATAQLSSGATQLAAGASSAATGAASAASGASQLADGASQVTDGASQLKTGIDTAKTTVDSKITDAQNDLKKTDGLSDYAEKPVSVSETNVNAIANYGTAFAPYFMSLSLWVGALLVFFGIYLDADSRIKILSRNTQNKMARIAGFVLIGVAQAVALALIVQFGLGLKVDNVPAFYFACILNSIVFISIVEFFIVNLKDVGKFLALLALILQLTSNGGTFPMETVPKFFNVIYPYMPMTYSVRLFKECITNFSWHGAQSDITVLLVIFAVFTVLNILFSLTRKVKAKFTGDTPAVQEG